MSSERRRIGNAKRRGLATLYKYGKDIYKINGRLSKIQRKMNLVLHDLGNVREEYSQLLRRVSGSDTNRGTKRR